MAVAEIIRQGVWFVDIPRTSTSSIKAELGKKFGPAYGKEDQRAMGDEAMHQWIPDHVPAVRMKRMVGPSQWSKLNTFSIVRNPWDRMLSIYLYRRKNEGWFPDMNFTEYVRLACLHRGRKWETNPLFIRGYYTMSCSDFLCDASGNLIISQVVKFENRDEVLRELGRTIGISDLGGVRLNAAQSKRAEYRDYYVAETQRLVEKTYKDDVETFGYKF